jgi:hypothetical protein
MRRLLAAAVVAGVGSAVLLGVVPVASAVPYTVTAAQCVAGGGFVDEDDAGPTGLVCYGGLYDGVPVTLG